VVWIPTMSLAAGAGIKFYRGHEKIGGFVVR